MSHSRSYVVGFSLPNLCCPTRLSIFVVPHLNNKVIMIKKEKEKGKQSNSHRIAIIPGDHKLFSTLRVSSGGLQSPVSISFLILIRNSFVRSIHPRTEIRKFACLLKYVPPTPGLKKLWDLCLDVNQFLFLVIYSAI